MPCDICDYTGPGPCPNCTGPEAQANARIAELEAERNKALEERDHNLFELRDYMAALDRAELRLAVAVGALEKLSRRHEGWEKAMGPCVCEAHVEARKIIAASLPESAKAYREVVERHEKLLPAWKTFKHELWHALCTNDEPYYEAAVVDALIRGDDEALAKLEDIQKTPP